MVRHRGGRATALEKPDQAPSRTTTTAGANPVYHHRVRFVSPTGEEQVVLLESCSTRRAGRRDLGRDLGRSRLSHSDTGQGEHGILFYCIVRIYWFTTLYQRAFFYWILLYFGIN